ncbi:MAG: hypothetical protein EBT51_08590 [Flavobacteriaceae bacterium]|nr:hypothetical protein [Flavobacteriaceae bacterium]
MTKQTAVEWLVDELRKQITEGTLNAISISELKMKAKEMEKLQIIDAYNYGQYNYEDPFGYYNETYGGDK